MQCACVHVYSCFECTPPFICGCPFHTGYGDLEGKSDILLQVTKLHLASGSVLIGVDSGWLTSFTVISPADDIYMEGCQASTGFSSPGAFYFEKTLPNIQYLVAQLRNISSCSELGPLDIINVPHQDIPTTSGRRTISQSL